MSLSFKEFFELGYWKIVKLLSKNLNNNSHYKYFYTSNFALSDEFYTDKIILDIGCGPMEVVMGLEFQEIEIITKEVITSPY